MLRTQPPARSSRITQTALASAAALAGFSPAGQAAFFEDSTATLETRNMYFNRDFRDGTSAQQSKRDEWAQGFMLNLQSGYTDGTVGFGVDALGMLGVKLDSSPDRTGTGLLPTHDDGRPNDGRILPQTFEGGLLSSREFKNLVFTGGRLNKAKDRDDTNYEDIGLNNKNSRFLSGATGKHFDFGGVDYKFADKITGSYHFAQLDDVYRQHFLGLVASRPMGPGTFGADLRLAVSDDTGAARGGKIDNTSLNGLFSYALNGHKLSAGYQHMSGDSAFPYVDGSDPYLVNFVQINDFAGAEERSWQARYDYDFAKLGIPGLSFMSRYLSGDNIKLKNGETGKEWERNSEIRYVVQSGTFKDVAVRLRNATYRSNYSARDADEVRLLVSYSVALW
eukprot:gene17287-20716_t